MNSKIAHSKPVASAGDLAKYALAILLVVAGVFAFYWFANQWATLVRALAVVGGLVLGGLVFMATAKGREVREFLYEVRFELRKVVWPTRDETVRTTLVIIAITIVLSLLLGLIDLILKWVVFDTLLKLSH